MFVDDILEFKDNFESLVYCKVEDDVIKINDEICYSHIPCGVLDKAYFNDKKYKEVNRFDYIREVNYYLYYRPITYKYFERFFNLNGRIKQILKKHKVNIYQIDIIMGALLHDMGGIEKVTSDQCYKMKRINEHTVQLQTPPNLIKKDNTILTTSSYFPNTVFILDYT